ncbi:MAG: hypothetical protein HWE16_11650 [Gammaproteobacteria bacterium]|nr:hypothetical protein [Gammaproteobacteria bacterium]
MSNNGSLVCVGLGMTLGSHITPAALHQIKTADIVFVAASNGIVEKWVESLNPNCESLQPLYSEDKPRKKTYKEMSNRMLAEVEKGKKVCGAFYGHPGVFALSPRKAIAMARNKGFSAYMEPGISAEACLYADLLLDPGSAGCQHYETSQFMYYSRKVDTAALLVLWQVGLAGDINSEKFSTSGEKVGSLQEQLTQLYSKEHEAIIYEAKVLPMDKGRKEIITLGELKRATLNMHSTLVVPPMTRLIDIKDKPLLNKQNNDI